VDNRQVAFSHALSEKSSTQWLCIVNILGHLLLRICVRKLERRTPARHAVGIENTPAMYTVGIVGLLLHVGGILIIPEVPQAATRLCRKPPPHVCIEAELGEYAASTELRGAASWSRGCAEETCDVYEQEFVSLCLQRDLGAASRCR
jgi:hypothetical protein